MLSPDVRFYQWEKYCKQIEHFMTTVEGDLNIYEADEDVPFAEELFSRLENLCDFMNAHLKELDIAYTAYDNEQANLWNNFRAWELGLCPELMKNVCILDHEKVAECKTQKGRSYQDTEQAILRWQEKTRA